MAGFGHFEVNICKWLENQERRFWMFAQ